MIKTIISIITASLLTSCSSDNKTAELKLDTMQCLMCSMKVEEVIVGLEGIKEIEVDLKSKSGKVTYKASLIDIGAIEEAITSIGYDVNGKKADQEAYEKLDICCKKAEDI